MCRAGSAEGEKPETPVFDFGGHWKNELGSYTDVTVKADDSVTRKYVSVVSGAGGPTPSTDLHGTVVGTLIVFTVNWGEAITTWPWHGVFDANSNSNPQLVASCYLHR